MSTFCADGLIPARFLCLVAHFIMLIMALNHREQNVKACLPYDYDNDLYMEQDKRLMIGYTLSIGFIGIEMFGFMSGITMFSPTNGFISMICHGLATVMMFYFLQDLWSCEMFWSVFFLCSILPCSIELIMIGYSFIMKK
ncbi:unnamed protein product [Aphis gossypii]|uniref:Transmembrane protein 107 n=1 Tax=Aphis gossypii TaxID=80765 RepID=A0A9P0J306_APHGO|nr:unnamed protein product [Aphis gossypii]